MNLIRRLTAVTLFLTGGACVIPALADSGTTTLTWAKPTTQISGGPLVGTYHRGTCAATSCAKTDVVVDRSVADSWAHRPGGLVVTVSWADRDTELDLFLYDSKGNELDMQNFGGVTSQRAFFGSPPAGTYEVWVQSFSGAATTFTGTISVATQPTQVATTAPSSMRFSPPALVDPQLTTAEPGIRLDRSGQSFVEAPWHGTTASSMLWRSQPAEGNLTYQLLQSRPAGVRDPRPRACSTSTGGFDSDITATSTGTLLFADLEAFSVSISRSSDDGGTWSCTPLGASTPDADRPWIAAAAHGDGDGPAVDAYLTYRAYSISGQFGPALTNRPARLQIDLTRDDGKTWQAAGNLADGATSLAGAPVYVKDPGQVFTDPAGGVFVPFASPNGRAYIARSLDGGATFTVSLVAQRLGTPDYGFVAGAADRGGNLYVAWVDQGTYSLVLSRSFDRGETWTAPVQVSPVGSTSALPWLAAGANGDVAVGWYGSAAGTRPDLAPSGATWFPYLARSMNATGASPVFETAALSPTPVHVGALCVADTPCDPTTRVFGDMLMVAIDPVGAVRASFDADAGASAPYLMTVEQIAGTGTHNGSTATTSEQRGDAAAPQLDLTALPKVVQTQSGTTLRMSLAATDNLSSAPAAFDNGAGTTGTWLLTWLVDGHVHFAGLNADPTGAPSFFGGTSPGAASFGPDSTYATYTDQTPAGATPVSGKIGGAFVDVNIPSWLVGPGSFSSLQAWTLVGAPQVSEPLLMQVTDSTPPALPEPRNGHPAPCTNGRATNNPHCN